MDISLINTSWTTIITIILATVLIYIALIAISRITGLRSFSKMSGFDFVVTIAIGSMIANTIVARNPPFLIAIIAFITLFALQMITARFRYKPTDIGRYIDNKPLLLMDGAQIIEKNMNKSSISRDELYAKLRERGVTQLTQIKAAVLETTGEVSVLMHNNPQHELDEVLLTNVKK